MTSIGPGEPPAKNQPPSSCDDASVEAFLRAHVRRPRRLDAFATALHARWLQAAPAIESAQRLLHAFAQLTATTYRAFEQQGQAAIADAPGTLEHRALVNELLAQVPSTHAAILYAHRYEGCSVDELTRRFEAGPLAIETYLSQACALMRTLAVSSLNVAHGPLIFVSREDIVLGQEAAHLLALLKNGCAKAAQECSAWLQCSSGHTREFLLARTWDRLLDECGAEHRARRPC